MTKKEKVAADIHHIANALRSKTAEQLCSMSWLKRKLLKLVVYLGNKIDFRTLEYEKFIQACVDLSFIRVAVDLAEADL